MTRDVIFVTGGGRLGNQLNNYSFLLSFKLEYPEFNAVTIPILPYVNDYGRTDLPLKDYDCLVGVHMRQGDYETWRDGKYYLSSKDYLKIIKKYERENSNKSIAFIIASDENQDNELFNQSNYYTGLGESQIEHYMEDFIKLMKCNIILGPPSTFSQWAAFLGEIPRVPLYQNAYNNQFKIIDDPLVSDMHKEIEKLI